MIQLLVREGFSVTQSHQAIASLHNLLIGQLMDQQHEQQLRQKIMDGNEFLKETVLFMRNYVVENQLEGFKESMQSHAELNEKALFLTSAQTYIEGLCQQNKRRENNCKKAPIEITMFVISIGAILRLFFYFSSISHANAR